MGMITCICYYDYDLLYGLRNERIIDQCEQCECRIIVLMYYWLGLSLLLSMGIIKIVDSVSGVTKGLRMGKVFNISTLDQIVKIIQCISIAAAACLQGQCSILPMPSFIKQAREAQKVRVLARDIRKIVKFIKSMRLIKVMTDNPLPSPKKLACSSFSQLTANGLRMMASYLKLLAQLCLVAFFLTNHYQTFSELGIMEFQEQNVEEISRFRLNVRMWYSILSSLSICINLIVKLVQLGVFNTTRVTEFMQNSLLDLSAHFCDIMFFRGLLHPSQILRWKVGLSGAMAASIRVYRSL